MKNRTIFALLLLALLTLVAYRLMIDKKAIGPTVESTTTNPSQKPQSSNRDPGTSQPVLPGNVKNGKAPVKLASEIVAGGRQWKLDFADQSLPPAARMRISYDLNLILGHLPNFEVDTLPFPIEVDGKKLDRRVRFEGKGRKWNKILQTDSFGCLFSGAKVEELYIPKPVVAAYTKAIALEKSNQAAYQQLDNFLAQMSKLKENPIENVRDLFVIGDDFKSAEADLAAMTGAEFAEGWGGSLYREPSILDVTETAGTSFEKYGSLMATTYAMSSGKLDDLPPIVFSNGKWRFLLLHPPT